MENRLTQLVELVVPGVSGGNSQRVINFTDQPYLRDKPILSLETYSISDLSVSPQNNDVVTMAVLKTAYLTLYTTNPDNPGSQGQWIQLQPMLDLHALQNGSDAFRREPFMLVGQLITWVNVGFMWPETE